jgi:hypothetical protein
MIIYSISIGFILFFTGAALIAIESEVIGLSIAIFGFLIIGLFMGLGAWLSQQEPYVKWHKLMALWWVGVLIYYIPDFLLAPGLLSPWLVYSPFLLFLIAFVYKQTRPKQS